MSDKTISVVGKVFSLLIVVSMLGLITWAAWPDWKAAVGLDLMVIGGLGSVAMFVIRMRGRAARERRKDDDLYFSSLDKLRPDLNPPPVDLDDVHRRRKIKRLMGRGN